MNKKMCKWMIRHIIKILIIWEKLYMDESINCCKRSQKIFQFSSNSGNFFAIFFKSHDLCVKNFPKTPTFFKV